MQLTRKKFHEQVYYYTLVLLAASLPLSIFTTSMFQIVLAINWLLEGRFIEKWHKAKKNRALLVFLLLFLLHIAGMIWSEDLAYGMRDIKIKLPLLAFPMIFATSVALKKRQVHFILLLFTLGVFAASVASVMKLWGLIPGEVEGYRDLSLFISHIRFSLMIVLALLIVIYFLFVLTNSISRTERSFYLLCFIWFPVFLVLLKSLSGIIIGFVLGFFILIRLVFEIQDRAIRFMVFVPVVMIPLFSIIYLGHCINKFYSIDELVPTELDTHTVEGNKYNNYPERREVENGHYIWLYICDEELEREWNRVSDISYPDGQTSNGNSLRGTLLRFLTSKGYRKDAAGVRKLTDAEIEAIEHGTANYIFMQRFRLYPRIYEVIWEIDRYRMGFDPNEKSVVMRFLYLDAGWEIAKKNLIYGVGNGDVKAAFEEHYNSVNSPLSKEWRKRAHNQFLTFLISFGIPGLLISIFALVGPLFLAGKQRSFLAVGFMILFLISMLNEDTLETAAGAAFVSFFYSLFLFGPDFPWLRRHLSKRNG